MDGSSDEQDGHIIYVCSGGTSHDQSAHRRQGGVGVVALERLIDGNALFLQSLDRKSVV